ncbi:hypothetical protein [Muricoccus aerilatus]|uniref:hypothetical protein n=1 Tax=Muricoccus aerilatus TaxID=452982 RepID=UPI0005C1E277|nr:hypothetical protein [Roseomonas aerilata]
MTTQRASDDPLVPATDEEIAAALAHALRFDARGKARRGGGDLAASLAAERLTEHLRQAGFVLMRGRGARPHSTG